MLITVAYACCDGCGRRVESDIVPPHWLRVSRNTDTEPQLFCTVSCLAETDGLDISQIRRYQASRWLLKPRDIEIIRCIAQGKSNGEIGRALGLSEATVKNRLYEQCGQKLGATSRIEIALVADRLGLIDLRAEAKTIVQRFPTSEPASETE